MTASLYVGNSGNGKELRFAGETHLLTVGPPGCGKSMGVMVQNLLSCPNSCVVIDPKGELAAITASYRRSIGKVVIINPFQVLSSQRPDLASSGYNPLAYLDRESDSFPNDCARIAEAIVLMERGKGEHFTASARQLITAGIMWAHMQYGQAATMSDVTAMLMGQNYEDVIDTFTEMMNTGYAPLTNKVSRFISPSDEARDVMATVSRNLESLDDPLIAADLVKTGEDFRMMKDETVTAYIILPPTEFERHQPWMRLVLNSAIYSLMTMPANNRPPVVFFMDEFFAAVGRLPVVERVMGITRGYGIQLWPVFQSLLQAKTLFGDNWETFISCAGVLQAFAPADLFTAEYLSRRTGKTTINVPNLSSSGISYGRTGVPFMLPQDIMGMGRGQTLIIMNGLPYPTTVSTKHYKQTGYAALATPNPYDVRYAQGSSVI